MLFVMDQVFDNEIVSFDGFHYVGCSFNNCTIMITSLEFGFDRCTFNGTKFYVNPKLPIFELEQLLDYDQSDRSPLLDIEKAGSILSEA